VHEVLAICEGDAVAGLRITLIANAFLKAEIDRLSAAQCHAAFARGKARKATPAKEAKNGSVELCTPDCAAASRIPVV
jgi:hypothetical protein